VIGSLCELVSVRTVLKRDQNLDALPRVQIKFNCARTQTDGKEKVSRAQINGNFIPKPPPPQPAFLFGILDLMPRCGTTLRQQL
jgi:hypothetical protein